MPSALVTALAAPIREVQSLVGPGWSSDPAGDPAAALGRVRDALADVSAAARRAWNRHRRTLVRRRSRRRGRVRERRRSRPLTRWPCVPASSAERPTPRRQRSRAPVVGCGRSPRASRHAPQRLSPTWSLPALPKSSWPRRADRWRKLLPSSTNCGPSWTVTPPLAAPAAQPAPQRHHRPAWEAPRCRRWAPVWVAVRR